MNGHCFIAILLLSSLALLSIDADLSAGSSGAASALHAAAPQQRPTVAPSPTEGPPRPTLAPNPTPSPVPRKKGQSQAADICLRLLAEPNSAVQAGQITTYQLVSENRGRGRARSVELIFAFAPEAQSLLDVTFSSPTAWVSALRPGEVEMRLEALESDATITATVRLRVEPSLPLGGALTTRAALNWSDSTGGGSGRSNRSTLVVAAAPASVVTVPLIILPAAGGLDTSFTITYDGFAAHEQVARWYHDPAGRVVALDAVQADTNGLLTFNLAASALPPGRSMLVAYGQCSQVTAVGTLTVGE